MRTVENVLRAEIEWKYKGLNLPSSLCTPRYASFGGVNRVSPPRMEAFASSQRLQIGPGKRLGYERPTKVARPGIPFVLSRLTWLSVERWRRTVRKKEKGGRERERERGGGEAGLVV